MDIAGLVTVLKYVMAHDIGRAINPQLVELQMEGGAAGPGVRPSGPKARLWPAGRKGRRFDREREALAGLTTGKFRRRDKP